MDKNPTKLTPGEVKQILLLILEHGRITFSYHCAKVRMPERNVTLLDIEYLFETGIPADNAEWSDEHWNWKYRIEGSDIDGEELTAITVIIEEHLVSRVITIF